MLHYDCALSLCELYGAIVAVRLTFMFIPINPIPGWFTVSSYYS
jgi:hypothetical protein